MTLRDRFIKSVIATAEADDTQFPWARGPQRRKSAMRRSTVETRSRRSKLASG